MKRFAPILYRDFWDVPRIFLVEHKGVHFLFDCLFDESSEDFSGHYNVYLLPELGKFELEGSWAHLSKKAISSLGEIPIHQVSFDETKRKEIDVTLLENLISSLPNKNVAPFKSAV